ncbi:MAG: response regulator, partial [Alphaproteobacteria bacterium]|nr:response regulator [Alphaproteobacteria bacterium]
MPALASSQSSFGKLRPMPAGSTAKRVTPLSSIRVMVIDDQRTMRAILRDLLHKVGIHDVIEASDGEDALKHLVTSAIQNMKPDVLLCDLHMEKMDGLEFIARIRRGKVDAVDKLIPILLITGESETMMLEVVGQVGASAV